MKLFCKCKAIWPQSKRSYRRSEGTRNILTHQFWWTYVTPGFLVAAVINWRTNTILSLDERYLSSEVQRPVFKLCFFPLSTRSTILFGIYEGVQRHTNVSTRVYSSVINFESYVTLNWTYCSLFCFCKMSGNYRTRLENDVWNDVVVITIAWHVTVTYFSIYIPLAIWSLAFWSF